MPDEECLSSNKNVDEDFKDELNDDEPLWRTPVMKAWEVKDEKNKIQGLWWIRWSWNDIIEIAWSSGKQDEQLRTKNKILWTSSGERD